MKSGIYVMGPVTDVTSKGADGAILETSLGRVDDYRVSEEPSHKKSSTLPAVPNAVRVAIPPGISQTSNLICCINSCFQPSYSWVFLSD